MATILDLNNKAQALNVQLVGSFGPFSMVKATPTSAEDTAESFSVTFPNLSIINFYMVQAFSTGNNAKTSDVDVTASGNVLTIAAGSTYTDIVSTDYFMILVGGIPKC